MKKSRPKRPAQHWHILTLRGRELDSVRTFSTPERCALIFSAMVEALVALGYEHEFRRECGEELRVGLKHHQALLSLERFHCEPLVCAERLSFKEVSAICLACGHWLEERCACVLDEGAYYLDDHLTADAVRASFRVNEREVAHV